MGLPAKARLREVGPRDGLQGEAAVAPEGRARLVDALAAAGLREIEAVSFVSPTAVPAMAGAADVLAGVSRRPDVRLIALVPNRRGAELAVEAGIDGLSVTVSASPAYNERNVRMTIEQSVDAVGEICAIVGDLPVDAVVSCAFGSPYEGDIASDDVASLGDRLLDAGATSLTYADTTGMATPRRIDDLVDVVGTDVGLHLHDARGTALVNAYAALVRGVARFDSSIGGLGGSPFATDAAGNLATEDFVAMLDDLGVETGVDLTRLLEASAVAADLVTHPLASRVAAVGPRDRRASD
ncbi:MAG: hydroxymethylglutaryl-CoA lyase [Actinobacteria bacterium]|nr:MAG: hydroxymethylglutaryl-CoA lyase [Actinomycetota bacterium]